ncbi:helix-turn-helix domain-containing protein [Sedimentitalea todarodis]|uniref:Helix-turn-helix domain-containing protein n=1 Tax=Sedimentitalea todarodis TaxID=1631240 RepID=A0ABU3VM18_9RHOB|nr:helix-turn-helix domain-containing protein [Sedimentitalea todarodis]MDU9007216.1 helix-turn-helix domain-containing protein [Sedimentitalea todarodis]
MPKQARLNGIKAFKSYTIEEAAAVSGVSPRTIRNWASDGLRVMDGARPTLIRGDDLRDYIKSQRAKRAVKTRIDTFYCVCCRKERRAAEGMADCDVIEGRAKLTALCEACGTVLSKPVAETRLPEIARTLDLKITRYDETLR